MRFSILAVVTSLAALASAAAVPATNGPRAPTEAELAAYVAGREIAEVERRAAPIPTVAIPAPQATIVGLGGKVEEFPGIPFAQKPVGALRLKPPVPLTGNLGTIKAQANGMRYANHYLPHQSINH